MLQVYKSSFIFWHMGYQNGLYKRHTSVGILPILDGNSAASNCSALSHLRTSRNFQSAKKQSTKCPFPVQCIVRKIARKSVNLFLPLPKAQPGP